MNFRLNRFSTAAGMVLAGALAATPIIPQAQPAPAKALAPAPMHCFYHSNINNFVTEGDGTIYIRVGIADVYRLDVQTPCPELSGRQSIVLEPTVGGSNICSAMDLTVAFRMAGGERRTCQVERMRQLTKDEIGALPKRDRP